MTDEKRPELEWPSEDLAQSRPEPEPTNPVEWPTADHVPEPTPPAVPIPPAPEPPPPAVLPATPPPEPIAPAPEPPPPAPEPAWTVPETPAPAAEPAAPAPEPFPAEQPPVIPFDIPPTAPPSTPPPAPAGPAVPQAFDIPPTPPAFEQPPSVEYQPPPEYQQLPPSPTGEPFAVQPPAAAPVVTGPYAVADGPDAPSTDQDESEARHSYFRPDIEGLRAVAVVAVLLFHIGLPWTTGGFVGVDVFYVISGFLITGLLLREGEESGRIDLLRFYARRMRRLLPAALLVIVVTLAASAAIVTPLRLTEIAGDAAAAALYVSNFRFALDAADYLALEAPSPLLHYWSLGVEEQFYLVWPLILLLATRILPLRFVGLFFLVLAVASFGLSLYWTEVSPAWAFFSPVTRAWELAAGALIAVGLLRIPARLPRPTASVAVIAGLALIVAAVILLGDETPFPGIAAVLPVAGATLVILGGVRGPTLPARIMLANPLSRYLGRISYSLYLWHWPILILVPIAIANDDLMVRVALAGAAIVVAIVSTELIEQPFRSSKALARRSSASVQVGLTASVAVGVAALMMSGAITLPANLIQPDPIVVELAGVREDLPRSYRDGCHLTFDVSKPKHDCVYGDPEGEQAAFLIGDSHAAQWLPALDAYAAAKGWRLEVHTKSACSVAPVPLWERKLRRTYDECFDWRTALLKRIKKHSPEVVFVGSSRDYELWDNGRIIQTSEAYTYWFEKLTELLTNLESRAGRVVLLAETPFLNFDPIDCLADDSIRSCDPLRRVVVDTDYAVLESAAADAAGASLLTLNEVLCPGANCPLVVDDVVVFRDRHHLTASYMEHLAEPVANLLQGRAPFPTPSPSLLPTDAGRAKDAG